MKTSKITACICAHEAQDALHGKGMRVHTKMKQREANNKMWRCTVCGKERESSLTQNFGKQL
jgi:hypothetical protein